MIGETISAGTHDMQREELLALHVETRGVAAYSSISTLYLPSGFSWSDGWELINFLLVEIHPSQQGVLALTYLTVEEYGEGTSQEDAVLDVLTSLSDYFDSLEAREGQLGEPAADDLARLRTLIRRNSTL